MFKNLKRNNKKGFTLIEILVVIALIGVLAAIALPRMTSVQADVKEKADVAQLKLWARQAEVAFTMGKFTNASSETAIETAVVLPTSLQGLVGSTTVADAVIISINTSNQITISYDPDGPTATAKSATPIVTNLQLQKAE